MAEAKVLIQRGWAMHGPQSNCTVGWRQLVPQSYAFDMNGT
jgi:hypothetical protein